LGNPVPGVNVSVRHKAYDPNWAGLAWTGSENWWTFTDGSGNYTIGGLPTDTDYKLNIVPDYNPGYALPIQYKDYYRRTWKNRPLNDALNTSVAPVAVDHDPVAVTIGVPRTGIDETITPGGYIRLSANGPDYPTGAVWCDVMYRVGSAWTEIDSGYTTGGTFAKNWKVMPVGTYRLDYADFFGRGSGSWSFDLGAGQTKTAYVMVPAPVNYIGMVSTKVNATFAGVVDTSTGDFSVDIQTLSSIPPTMPLPPSSFVPMPQGIYGVTLGSADATGTWTLTLPYDPSIPDASVPYIRVRHYKHNGTVEELMPSTWDTIHHVIQVQTSSLSPFQVGALKRSVKLGTPVASSKWRRGRLYTVWGSISPWHSTGAHSAKFMVYRRNSHGKYVLYKNPSTHNYQYRGGTRFHGKFSLKSGRYRIYSYAFSDKWHLAAKSSHYKSVTVK
jgi:hypothetical protein